jgi:peptide/nickel transport system permease protein
MQRYLARRLLLFVPTLLLASVIIFVVMRILPGDVALVILGAEEGAPVQLDKVERLRESLGLNEPLPVQYGRWVWRLVNGEFGGHSLVRDEPIASIVGRRLPVTLQLAGYAAFLAVIVSLPLGVLAALYQNRWPDYLVRVATVAGLALPHFWVALLLLLVLVLVFRWSPPLFYQNVWEDPWTHLQQVIWPALLLAWGYSSFVIRVTRSTVLEVIRQDYVRTARSKGLRERIVLSRHVLRNALIPVITLGGLQLAGLLSGTVILENIFAIPGLGQAIVQAAMVRDFPVVQTLAVLLVLFMLSLNLLVDILYVFVDPRIRYA